MNDVEYDQIMKMRRFICAALLLLAVPLHAAAAELVMVEQPGCEWCEAWDEQIGDLYHKTREGGVAPLRRIDIHDRLPHDLAFIRGLVYTPTFVLVHEGREIGRIQGYPGEDFFWGLLQQLLGKLPVETNWRARPEDGGARSQLNARKTGMRG